MFDGSVKVCPSCEQAKPKQLFRSKRCNACVHRARDQDKVRAVRRAWRAANVEKVNARKRYDGQLARDRRRHEQAIAEGYLSHVEKVAMKAAEREAKAKEERAVRAAREAERQRKAALPWNAPGITSGERWRIRYRLDPEFAIIQRLRAADRHKKMGPHSRLGTRLRYAMIRGKAAPPKTDAIINYSAGELKAHLQRQFKGRMSWKAFCAGHIHIDHIVPLSLFDLTNPDEARAAWALSNLRPMWGPDNIRKRALRTLLL